VTILGLFYWRPGITHEKAMEAMAKRAQYELPEGATTVFEYWAAGAGPDIPAVVGVYEMADFGPMLETELVWGEYFQMKMLPAVSADDGIKMGADIMQHIAAMA